MKRLFLLACLFGAASVRTGASPIEDQVKAIRQQYAQIESGLAACRQVKRDLPDESAEGGELIAYFKDADLRKLSAKFFGETGKAAEEFYFSNGRLIFVLRVESRYTEPMSGVVKTKTEERFYFADNKLIRWLNPDNKEVTSDAAAAERERELLAAAKKYSAMARQER